MATFTPIVAEQEVTVIIEPCTVLSYDATQSFASMIYYIGDADLTKTYSFDESPTCEYAEVVTVTGLPAFMTHDEGLAELTVH